MVLYKGSKHYRAVNPTETVEIIILILSSEKLNFENQHIEIKTTRIISPSVLKSFNELLMICKEVNMWKQFHNLCIMYNICIF